MPRPRFGPLAVGLLALATGSALAWATAGGLGASPDSVQYLRYVDVLTGVAPLRTDEGLSGAVTHFPPLYPCLLAALARVGGGPMAGTRALNVVCYAGVVALAAATVWRSGRDATRAALAGGLVAVQPAVLGCALWAWSEPPFLLLTMTVAAVLARPSRRHGPWTAAATGATIAAATLTRYAGVALLPGALWAVARRRRTGRWRDAAVLTTATLVPLAALAIAQRRLGGAVAGRSIEFHAVTAERWLEAARTLRDWLTPPFVTGPAAWAAAAVLAAALVAGVAARRRRSRLGRVAGPLVAAYVVGLLGSMAFVDNATPLDDRILSPVALLLTVCLAADLPTPRPAGTTAFRRAGPAALAAVAVVGIAGMTRDWRDVRSLRANGLGFNHARYRDSPLVAACHGLPADAELYSNFPDALRFQTGRDARLLPGRPTAYGRFQESVDDGLARVRARLGGGGYVAYFARRQNGRAASVRVTLEELRAAIPLRVVTTTADGVLLRSP